MKKRQKKIEKRQKYRKIVKNFENLEKQSKMLKNGKSKIKIVEKLGKSRQKSNKKPLNNVEKS